MRGMALIAVVTTTKSVPFSVYQDFGGSMAQACHFERVLREIPENFA
jgi:hypothetical protein